MPVFVIRYERNPNRRLEGVYLLRILSIEPQQIKRKPAEIDNLGASGSVEYRWRVTFEVVEHPEVKVWDIIVLWTPSKRDMWMLRKSAEFFCALGLQDSNERLEKPSREIRPETIEGKEVFALITPRVTSRTDEEGKSFEVVWHTARHYIAKEEKRSEIESDF